MPSSFVTAVNAPICAGDVAVTVTPGSTPPLSSTTWPLMLPVELAPPPWANAGIDAPSASTMASTRVPQRFMCASSNCYCKKKPRTNERGDRSLNSN